MITLPDAQADHVQAAGSGQRYIAVEPGTPLTPHYTLDRLWCSPVTRTPVFSVPFSTPTHDDGMCQNANSWPMAIFLAFVSLVLWTLLLAMICSMKVCQQVPPNNHTEEEEEEHYKQLRQRRMEYLRCRLQTKRIRGAMNDDNHEDQNECSCSLSPTTCYICLESFSPGEVICESESCRHKFHMKGCMEEWLLSHDECPVCRQDYVGYVNDINDSRSRGRRPPYVSPLPRTLSLSHLARLVVVQDPTRRDGRILEREMEHEPGYYDRRQEFFDSVFMIDDLPPWLIFAGAV